MRHDIQLTRLAAALAAVLFAVAPATAQETPDTASGRVLYRAAAFPVWVAVADAGGAVRAAVHVRWSDSGSSLPFSSGLEAGDIEVLLPSAGGGTCIHTGAAMAYGSGGFEPASPPVGCASPPVRLLGGVSVEHGGTGPMACVEAERSANRPRVRRAVRLRVFGCYWAEKPGG